MTKGITLPFRVSISPTLKIRGLIATKDIAMGEVIERCPALIYPVNNAVIEQTIFNYYVFEWDEIHEALALGYGSLCNHSYHPNTDVDFDREKQEIIFTAKTSIAAGEEILINYNDDSQEPIDPGYLDFDNKLRN